MVDEFGAVAESNEADNDRQEALTDVGSADLRVNAIELSPADNLGDGTAVDVMATVGNSGDETLRSFFVRFEVDGALIGTRRVDGLPSSGSTAVTQPWTATAGQHTLRVLVDSTNTVPESDEGNNDRTLDAPAVPFPDLLVKEILFAPAQPSEGTNLSFTARVQNTGADTSRTFAVRFEIDGDFLGRRVVDGLGAGQIAEVSGAWVATVGQHAVRVVADELGVVPELDETNNDRQLALPGVDQADLALTALSWSPATNIFDGQEVTLTATVTNVGVGGTNKDFFVRFEVDGNYLGRQRITGGLATDSGDANQTWVATSGVHTVEAIADEYGAVGEPDETNNRLARVLPEVSAADLTLSNLVLSPANMRDGEDVTLSGTLENTTPADTLANFFVRFEVDGTLIGRYWVKGGLPGAGSMVVSETWNAAAGLHDLRIVADEYDEVAEADEGNNLLAQHLANDKFFIQQTSITNVSDVDGTGVLVPGLRAEINWLFIPTPGAGGDTPFGVRYTARAVISGTFRDNPIRWETLADEITVEAMPRLTLDYFLPEEVEGDDPMTVGVHEPVVPFIFGVRVTQDRRRHRRGLDRLRPPWDGAGRQEPREHLEDQLRRPAAHRVQHRRLADAGVPQG